MQALFPSIDLLFALPQAASAASTTLSQATATRTLGAAASRSLVAPVIPVTAPPPQQAVVAAHPAMSQSPTAVHSVAVTSQQAAAAQGQLGQQPPQQPSASPATELVNGKHPNESASQTGEALLLEICTLSCVIHLFCEYILLRSGSSDSEHASFQ